MKNAINESELNSFNVRYATDHKMKAGDILSIGLKRYQIGSVASYEIENNECPIKGVARAQKNGHELHYVFGLGACLSAGGHRPDYGTKVAYGEDVYFEGRVFKFERAPNDNIKLIEVVYPEPDLG